jgi:hypothetical protein
MISSRASAISTRIVRTARLRRVFSSDERKKWLTRGINHLF